MKQENKKCRSCGSFRAYYTTAFCSLMRENNGYCSRHGKVTEKNDSCDHWRCRYLLRDKRTRVVVKTIPEIYKKVVVIEQILRQDAELRKIYDEIDDTEN